MASEINVNELKDFVDFISNKEQSGNSMSPDQFNMLLKRGTHDLIRWLYGLVHDMKPGFPMPTIAYEKTQKIKDDLRQLKRIEPLNINSHGFATFPDNYIAVTAIIYDYVVENRPGCEPVKKEVSVEILDDQSWADRISSSLKAPSRRHPVCIFHKDEIEFRPVDLYKAKIMYLAEPEVPKWGYYIDGESDVPLYKESESKHVQLPYILTNDLARIILSYIGINLRENQVIEYAEMIKQKGV